MAEVFVSYSRANEALAKRVESGLKTCGFEAWRDDQLPAHRAYSEIIEQRLRGASAVVVLWSKEAAQSQWVRAEADFARTHGKLVQAQLDDTLPPMPFNQIQCADLRGWRGGGSHAGWAKLQSSVKALVSGEDQPTAAISKVHLWEHPMARWAAAAAALLLVIAASASAWFLLKSDVSPAVAVAAADDSPPSRALANDMFVKFGSLAQLASGKWQLIENVDGEVKSDLLFQAAAASTDGTSKGSLMLLDGHKRSVLWSHDFEFPEGRSADLRQQVSLTAGRVLACALEAREKDHLPRNLLKLFLAGCAELAGRDTEPVVSMMAKVIAERPHFSPAWSRLLLAESYVVQNLEYSESAGYEARRKTLLQHIGTARKSDPTLPEAFIVEAQIQPYTAYAEKLALIVRAKAVAPENSEVFAAESNTLLRVGRMLDAVGAAERAAKLDPLSPTSRTNLIMALETSGKVEAARAELGHAERSWAGTAALREAQRMFHLRSGDPRIALRMAAEDNDNITPMFIHYRLNPSTENAARLVEHAKRYAARASGYPLHGFGEAHATEEAFALMARSPTRVVARNSGILFRPALKDVRRDLRFMQVAKRIGLLKYWRTSGHWPDFCKEMDLPYDCKTEAAKLNA
ncbi:MAG TPA: TIR domain-containing protein [Sphingomicrobium sp.]|nr:TIR domain-containing protein [Sphingomicrobium sp.]